MTHLIVNRVMLQEFSTKKALLQNKNDMSEANGTKLNIFATIV